MPEQPLPNYETIPLRSDEVTVCAIQSRLRNIDPKNACAEKMANIELMGQLVYKAQSFSGRKDLIAFHESPIGGFDLRWTKEEFMAAGVDLPGEETDAIGKIAQRHRCYIEFGCYAKLPDWPGRFVNMGVIVGPTGNIVYKRWKVRNLSAFADLGTTVYDVLDEYVKRYGWDSVYSVARTDIGNIAIIPEVMEPELARAYAINGVEILIRYMTLGANHWTMNPMMLRGAGRLQTFRMDLQAMCLQNGVYGIFVNDALVPQEGLFEMGEGHSAIIDCDGSVLFEASVPFETSCEAVLPLAAYRKKHSIPRFPKELYSHVFDHYTPKYPPNSYLEKQPNTIKELSQHYKSIARW